MTNTSMPPTGDDISFKDKIREMDAIVAYHIILEKFWLIISCVAVLVLLALVYITLSPRIYQAISTIEVDQNDTPMVTTTQQGQSMQPNTFRDLEVLKTIEMELQRRSLLVRVLKRPEFQGNAFLGELTVAPDSPAVAPKVEQLQRAINPKLRRNTRLIDICVDFPDPVTAQMLANAVATEYLLEIVTTRSGNSADVTRFLEEESDKMKVKLAQTELALQDYKAVVDIRTRIIETEREIENLNKRYLPKHPKLIAAQNLLKDLKTQFVVELQKRAALSGGSSAAGGADVEPMSPDRLDHEMAKQESRYNVLQRDLQTDRALYEALQQRRKEATVATSSKLVSIHVVEPAMLPNKPIKPRKMFVILLAVVGGSVIGLVLAFWLNSLDSSLKTVDEAEGYLGMALLGAIPECVDTGKQKLIFEAPFGGDGKIEALLRKSVPISQEYYGRARKWKEEAADKLKHASAEINGNAETPSAVPEPTPERAVVNPRKKQSSKPEDEPRHLVLIEDPASIVSESFRNMRAALKLLGREEERKTFLFTSAVPSEGKSFTAANFAVSLAQEGVRVLLIDADLRRPTAHKTFHLGSVRNGVTDYISGQTPLEKVINKTEVKNLDVMVAGSMAPNPAELISGGGFRKMIEEVSRMYDRVVIDSAPIHAVSDTLLICDQMHTVCLVVRAGSTPREAVGRAARMLKSYGARLSGFVMNRVPMRTGFGYNPYYYYYQSSEKYGEAYGGAYGASRKS